MARKSTAKPKSTTNKATPKHRPLQRPQRKRLLAGVCAAFADYFNHNVDHVRFLFIILTFIGGVGLVAYLLLWLLIPEK